MKTATEIAEQVWFELTVIIPPAPAYMDERALSDGCKEILARNFALALLDERKACADVAIDGGMHYTQEQDIRNAVADAILARPAVVPVKVKYKVVEVTLFGHDVPIEVEYTGDPSDAELYEMAKDLLRRTL